MTKEQREKIENYFIDRMEFQQIKEGSKKYLLAQADFFVGAMAALDETNPMWCICISSGRIIKNKKGETAV